MFSSKDTTCKYCGKTFLTKYNRKRHEEKAKCCEKKEKEPSPPAPEVKTNSNSNSKSIEEMMKKMTVSRRSSSSRKTENALDILINLASQEKKEYPLTSAVKRMSASIPSVYRKTKQLPSTDPLQKNLRAMYKPTLLEVVLRENDNQRCMTWSHDGVYLACGTKHGFVYVWDTKTGKVVKTLPSGINTRFVNGLNWIPSTYKLIIGYETGLIRIWDIQTNSVVDDTVVNDEDAEINGTTLSKDGKHFALISFGDVFLGKMGTTNAPPTKYKKLTESEEANEYATISFSNDGSKLVSHEITTPYIPMWATQTGTLSRREFETGTVNMRCFFAWSPDGSMLAVGAGTMLNIYDTSTKYSLRHTYAFGTDSTQIILSIAWSPDGKMIAIGSGERSLLRPSNKGHVLLWKVSQTEEGVFLGTPKHLMETDTTVNSVEWSPDGRSFATNGMNGKILLWNDASIFDMIQGGKKNKTAKANTKSKAKPSST